MPSRYLAAFAILLIPAAACAQGGWQPVRLADLRGTTDFHFRENGADFLSATGDFDGDAKPDQARLVRNMSEAKYAVEVVFGAGRTERIAEGPIADLPRMAVSMVGSGLYSTACAKGYGDRSIPCERRNIDLKSDAISLYTFESAGRYLYWSAGRLEEVWISD